ncbi:hypothetical protein HNR34_002592 [Geobacillus subterraneus]
MCKSKRSIAIPILNIISALVKKLGPPHLKDPFFTDEIDVKKPERVAVLGYLFLLAWRFTAFFSAGCARSSHRNTR